MKGTDDSVAFEGSYDPALQLLVPVEDAADQFRGTQRTAASRRQFWWRSYAAWSPERQPLPPPPRRSRFQPGRRTAAHSEEHVAGDRSRERSDGLGAPAGLAQQWPGPLIDGFVNLSSADAAEPGIGTGPAAAAGGARPARAMAAYVDASGGCSPRSRCSWRFRMARDIGIHEAGGGVRSHRSARSSRHRLQPMRNAWIRYRIMACVVGTLLVGLGVHRPAAEILRRRPRRRDLDRDPARLSLHDPADHRRRPGAASEVELETADPDCARRARCPSCRSSQSVPQPRTSGPSSRLRPKLQRQRRPLLLLNVALSILSG